MRSVDGAEMATSRRTFDTAAVTWPSTTGAPAPPAARPLNNPPDAPNPRVQLALLMVTLPVTIGVAAGPCSARLASTSERMPSG